MLYVGEWPCGLAVGKALKRYYRPYNFEMAVLYPFRHVYEAFLSEGACCREI